MDEDEECLWEPDDMDRFLKNQIVRLTIAMTEEPDALKREILQARIDNLRIAQRLWAGMKAEPGHA